MPNFLLIVFVVLIGVGDSALWAQDASSRRSTRIEKRQNKAQARRSKRNRKTKPKSQKHGKRSTQPKKKKKDYKLLRTGKVSEVLEVFETEEFVKFLELDPLPRNIIEWSPDSSKSLYVTSGRPPQVFLSGRIRPGYSLYFNHRLMSDSNNEFCFRYSIPLETATANFAIQDPFGKVSYYRFLSHWIDYPPALVVTIRDEKKIVRKAVGFDGYFRPSAFVQLYAKDRPLRKIDLDALKHSRMSFRVLSSIRDNYDGWQLTIRNSNNKVVGRIGRFGTPPSFIDWREVSQDILHPDVYFYQLNVFFEGKVYEGRLNHFEAVEGASLVNYRYLHSLRIEPEAGFAFFRFTNNIGQNYGNIAGQGDLIVSLWNRAFIRGSTLISIHNENQEHLYTFTRIGAGIRFTGSVRHPWLGDPFIVKMDITFARTGFTVSPTNTLKRFAHFAVLAEPQFIFLNRFFITPWAEFGASGDNASQQRGSLGIKYNFFVRPWSVKVGFEFAIDKLLKLETRDDPNLFTTVRGAITLRFFL